MNKGILLISFLLLVASCTTEIDQQFGKMRSGAPGAKVVFQAAVEECTAPETKVYADESMKVLWNADDRISIFNQSTYNWQFAFEGDDGDTAGGFEPVGEGEPGSEMENVYAVYPYKSETALSTAGVLTTVLPAEQAYKAHSFGIGANTMVAVTGDNFLAFKNVGGYVELRLYGDNISVRRITIKGNNGEKIAGKAEITMPLGGVPEVTMDGSASDAVSIVCDKPVKIGANATDYTDFWLVLPPVTFTGGFEITVVDDMGGTYTKKTAKNFEVKRNTLDWMAPLKVELTYDNEIIRFADDNFKAYCVENFDKNGDKEISKSEAAAVRTINVNTDNITSLQGIEYFTNLTTLYCRGTNRYNSELHITEYFGSLTSLDVSQNTALTSLWCGGNQLTSLDVSHNTALTDLRCYHNPLGSLDISKNSALTILYCQSNELAELDVSHNPALTKIQCLDNQLTSLDVSNNTSLTDLKCYNNQLTSLNLGDNTALTLLYCQNNQLTALDVSRNTALTELHCYNNQLADLNLGDNTVLTLLDCHNNQLTALDVSKNTALAELICRNNQLTSLNVNGATALTKLSCEYNKLITIDLQNNPQLSYCNTWNNPSLLEIWLKVDQTIATFYCDYSVTLRYTGDDTIIAFADANFKAYCLANFDYDQDGEITVAEGLSITTINVTTDNITSLQGIEHFSNLRYLTCNGTRNWNSALGQEEFLGSLVSLDVSQNTKLSNLYCPNNKLTSLDISHNAGLVYLTCNHNQLTSLDVKNNPELNGLDCSDNPLSSLNIRNNANLVSLSCDNNQLTGLDLSLNTELSHLTCNNNQLSILDVSHNTKMSFIQCSGNQLTSLDFGSNPLLTSINCCSNQLTTLNLVNNTALTSIQCDYNRMTGLNVSTCAELTMLYCSHNLLTTLDVSHNLKLESLSCYSNPSLLEIWLKTGQTIPSLFQYDENVADIKYKD